MVADVRYVLEHTKKSDLTFVGWSQGSTQVFIAGQGPDTEYLAEHAPWQQWVEHGIASLT